MKRLLSILLCSLLFVPAKAEIPIPRDYIPEDHMAWFGLRGAVKEVVEYGYNNYGKTIWRFDTQGRLTEYIDYTHPFFENGGCVFGLWAHYRYAYDEQGKILFLETYHADYNTVDDYADLTLELFPRQIKDADFRDKAEKEYGDTTFCFSQWHEKGEMSEYFGIRYDRYGNWFEQVHTTEDGHACASVRVREIKYYKDIDLFDLPVGVKAVMHHWTDDGRAWGNRYDFDQDGNITAFRSWVDDEMLYEWTPADSVVLGSDLISQGEGSDKGRQVYYWTTVPVGELKALPEEINQERAFDLCFDYMGYAFEGSLYPLRNGWWVVLSHWCLDEEETIYLDEEDATGEPVPAHTRYRDPFAGMWYPIIWTDSIGFMTRNYGGETIKCYENSYGKKVQSKLTKESSLRVLDADPQTRRLFCAIEEDGFERAVGWIDEEWVCANLLTTCP